MHRSSESVAAIATALAKAQTELSNPEKAMVGTVYNNRTDAPQSFRYASLSSGLDIVRKTLGSHQIAIAQTTDIDRASGTVNLITVLLHTSGEWISSDWPVCKLSETSMPRRMGAALSYARRYALFTMVGIAGEDDVDAPPDAPDDPRESHNAVTTNPGLAPGPVPASQCQTGKGTNTPALEKLNAEESSASGAELIQEIECLPGDGLQARAIAILKAKNRLSPDDAKQVEEAFAAKMAQLERSPEAVTHDAPASSQNEPTLLPPLQASTQAVKRARGRPRKAEAVAHASASPPVSSTVDDSRTVPKAPEDGSALGKIDKSVLTIREPRRLRDKVHLKFVASQPCLICARTPADAHHLRFAQPRAMGLKVSDEFTVPLCRTHHRENHRVGDEQIWWSRQSIDPLKVSRQLWTSTRRIGWT